MINIHIKKALYAKKDFFQMYRLIRFYYLIPDGEKTLVQFLLSAKLKTELKLKMKTNSTKQFVPWQMIFPLRGLIVGFLRSKKPNSEAQNHSSYSKAKKPTNHLPNAAGGQNSLRTQQRTFGASSFPFVFSFMCIISSNRIFQNKKYKNTKYI